MKEAIFEMNCRREKLGMSWKDLASRMRKDPNLVLRQYTEDSNPTLETLEQYAAAIGGSIHFLPADWSDRVREMDKTKADLDSMQRDIIRLESQNALLHERIQKQDELLDKRMRRIDDLQELLTRVINKLLDKA